MFGMQKNSGVINDVATLFSCYRFFFLFCIHFVVPLPFFPECEAKGL